MTYRTTDLFLAERCPDLYRITVRGVEYIASAFVAIRADLLDHDSDPRVFTTVHAYEFSVPDRAPGPSTRRFNPLDLYCLHWAGMTVREGSAADTTRSGSRRRQHVYLGDEHVGWIMPAADDAPADRYVTVADVPAMRALLASLWTLQMEEREKVVCYMWPTELSPTGREASHPATTEETP